MVKRLLAFVLAGAMVIETPAAAYAAEQTPITVETGVENSIGGGTWADTVSIDETEAGEVSPEEDEEDGNVSADSSAETDGESDGTENAGNDSGIVDDADSAALDDETAQEVQDESEPQSEVIEDETITLTKVDADSSVGAYDFVQAYEVKAAEGQDVTLADSYVLNVSIKKSSEPDTAYSQLVGENSGDGDIALNSTNSYKATVYSAQLLIDQLLPGTGYSLKWELKAAEASGTVTAGTVIKTVTDTITTNNAEIALANTINSCYEQEFTVTLDAGDVANLDSYSRYISLSAYIKESTAAETEYTLKESGLQFSKNNGYSNTLLLDDLKDNTSYDIQLRNSEGTVVYKTETFSTPADNREIKVVSVEPAATGATIDYTVSGTVNSDDYVVVYYREKRVETAGQEEPEWIYLTAHAVTNNIPFTLSGLTPETDYEYILGFSSDAYAVVGDLKKTAQNEFTTLEAVVDNRTITVSDKAIGATRAMISYTVGGDNSDYVLCFYREKNAQETGEGASEWQLKYNHPSYTPTFDLQNLTPETAYEYKIGFISNFIYGTSTVADLVNPIQGEFTTQADTRVISNDKVEVNADGSTLSADMSVSFSGNTYEEYTYIHYFYKIEDSTYWEEYEDYDYTNEASRSFNKTITGLVWDKTYDYAIVISDSYGLENPDDVTKDGWKLTGKFVTPPVTAPTSITLSQTEVYLNVGSYGEGAKYLYQSLVAAIAPANAAKELVIEYTNPNVALAEIDEDNGKVYVNVYAIAVGETEITVKSLYAENVSAKFTVKVGNYKVIITGTDGKSDFIPDDVVAYKRNVKSIETYHLCEVEEDSLGNLQVKQIVQDVKVTSKNESIVKWSSSDNKLITGNLIGNTELVFSDGKYIANLTVYTITEVEGFNITGLNTKYSQYKAIANDSGYTIAYNDSLSLSYTPIIEAAPSNSGVSTNPAEFKWESNNDNIVTIDNGIITPKGVGEVTITATREVPEYDSNTPETVKTITMETKLTIVEYPDEYTNIIYALANTVTKLGDIKCPGEEGGWRWKYPDTPLVTNAVNTVGYTFETVCDAAGKYPRESKNTVYIGKVTGMSVSGNADAILEVAKSTRAEDTASSEPSMTLTVYTNKEGNFNFNSVTPGSGYDGYSIEIPTVSGLDIQAVTDSVSEYGMQQFTIKATKAGNYTLKPEIKVNDGKGGKKVLAKATYKFKAVDGAIVNSIELNVDWDNADPAKVSKDPSGRIYVDMYSENEVGGTEAGSVKTFEVEAVLKTLKDAAADPAVTTTSAELKNTKLIWKISDAKVAKVAPSSDTHKATVTVIGEGHTVLTATAKDAAGRLAKLNIEIRNHAPRVNVSKVTVNTAYDYENDKGISLAAASSGAVEIVPASAYGGSIQDVKVYKDNEKRADLEAASYGTHSYVIGAVTKDGVTSNPKSDKYELRVTTYEGKTYKYPLQVTVVNKPAKVTVKSIKAANLFYKGDKPQVGINVSGTNNGIDSVTWQDEAGVAGTAKGFASTWTYDWDERFEKKVYFAAQGSDISLTKNKPDPKITKGKFAVKLYGYKDPIEVKATIKCNYKKPSLVTNNSSTTIVPSAGYNEHSFYLWNKTDDRSISYADDDRSSKYYCNSVKLDKANPNVRIKTNNLISRIDYEYVGKGSGSENITLKLESNAWREPLTVKHTIKTAKPTAVLTVPQVTINTNEMGRVSTSLMFKNSGWYISCDDIAIEGKDAKSAKLLSDDLLEIAPDYYYGDTIYIKQNRAKTMGKSPISAGTYSYKLTPYYKDADGKRQALNALVLKVKVVNKAVTAKTKAKGTLDLVKAADSCNFMEYTTAFTNLGSNYTINNIELTGEYADYFTITDSSYSGGYTDNGRLKISSDGVGKLRAGQKYKLALKYTITMKNGDTFTVTGSSFTVTPKQTAPKVTVKGNNQTLYAGSTISRSYTLETPEYKYKEGKYTYSSHPYKISRVYGSIDCNKDGVADIVVNGSGSSAICNFTVKINDRDGVLTTTGAKGKTYSIPVTVQLRGRDGISKDVKTTIKVTVKR